MENCGTVRIVIIPGNPGLKEYYYEFMDILSDELKLKSIRSEISTNNHIGHGDEVHDQNYSLDDQINYHRAKILQLVQSSNIVLIGHSIGCYIILKLLEQPAINSRVTRVFLLFPTIETIANTPQGISIAHLLRSSLWRWFIVSLVTILVAVTSVNFRRRLISWYLGREVHQTVVNATVSLLSPGAMRQVLYMGMTEMDEVKEIDVADWHIIEKISTKTVIYYGRNDHWCPIEMCYAMRKRYARAGLPLENVRLDNYDIDHAFVMCQSREMAEICASMM